MGWMTRREDSNIKSSFVPVMMLYITVSKREAATPVLTVLPLHRILKVQFHTIAVGVSVRGILKKKAIKPGYKVAGEKLRRGKERTSI